MPLYDYQCRACGKVTEVRHGFNETYEEACAECRGEMRRVFSPTGIVFKGSGFYVTDSRKSSEGSSKGGDSPKTEVPAKAEGSPAAASGTAAKAEGSPPTGASSSPASTTSSSSTSESAA